MQKFGWPSMKVLQIKERRLKLFGCLLKLLANVQCTSTRKRSVKLIPASYFTDSKKKEHKCLKKSTVFILHFAPSLRFTLSLHSAFYTQSAFYPWSAVCVLHWPLSQHICNKKNQWYCYRIFLGQQKGCLCVLLYSDYMLRTVSIFFFFIDNKLTTLIHSRK